MFASECIGCALFSNYSFLLKKNTYLMEFFCFLPRNGDGRAIFLKLPHLNDDSVLRVINE